MPALPTLTITDEQAARCLAAWGSAGAYRAWLAGQVRGYVRAQERAAALAEILSAQEAALAAVDASDPIAGNPEGV